MTIRQAINDQTKYMTKYMTKLMTTRQAINDQTKYDHQINDHKTRYK